MTVTPEERARIIEETDWYWHSVIAQLAHTQAATAEQAGLVKRTSKSERARQAKICQTYINVLEGKPVPDRRYSEESALKRLRSCIDLLEQP